MLARRAGGSVESMLIQEAQTPAVVLVSKSDDCCVVVDRSIERRDRRRWLERQRPGRRATR